MSNPRVILSSQGSTHVVQLFGGFHSHLQFKELDGHPRPHSNAAQVEVRTMNSYHGVSFRHFLSPLEFTRVPFVIQRRLSLYKCTHSTNLSGCYPKCAIAHGALWMVELASQAGFGWNPLSCGENHSAQTISDRCASLHLIHTAGLV